MPIERLKTYIDKNKRLPNFDNADYYVNNGVKVSEIIVKQQEKIEELFLYIIGLNDRIKELEAKK